MTHTYRKNNHVREIRSAPIKTIFWILSKTPIWTDTQFRSRLERWSDRLCRIWTTWNFSLQRDPTVRHFFPWPESQQNLSHFSNYNTKIKTSGVRSAELLPLGQVHALGWSHSNSTCEWIWNNNILHNKYQFRLLLVKPDMWNEISTLCFVWSAYSLKNAVVDMLYM